MENTDITQIEAYLRGKMPPEERTQFESALATNPELRQRTDELRQFANDLREVARADLRKRVEAVRDQIKQEEAVQERPPENPPSGWIKSAMLLAVGMLLGLALGWLLFYKEPPVQDNTDDIPVATPQYDEIANIHIPGPQPGKTIQLNIRHKPDLEKTGALVPARTYALDPGAAGLCIYARLDDYFWRNPLELVQVGSQFFLKIGNEKFLLIDDGEEYPFPEKPFGN